MTLTTVHVPFFVAVASLLVLWTSTVAGSLFARRRTAPGSETQDTLKLVTGATLTLLGLVMGFSFSMAIARYDQRKIYEEEEANAIGTEYLRVELLPSGSAELKDLLMEYIAQRSAFYEERDEGKLSAINVRTSALQRRMWTIVRDGASKAPTPAVALAATGMNDVLNSQGYTQAAWANRIPEGAWLLMAVISVLACMLAGYTSREARPLLILAVVLSVAFFFIADIDSPRRGTIRVVPRNLASLSDSLRAR